DIRFFKVFQLIWLFRVQISSLCLASLWAGRFSRSRYAFENPRRVGVGYDFSALKSPPADHHHYTQDTTTTRAEHHHELTITTQPTTKSAPADHHHYTQETTPTRAEHHHELTITTQPTIVNVMAAIEQSTIATDLGNTIPMFTSDPGMHSRIQDESVLVMLLALCIPGEHVCPTNRAVTCVPSIVTKTRRWKNKEQRNFADTPATKSCQL
nr:hypothetical protein [Tanacetum cinerariifolium]